jgi:hypothetical protein
MEVLLRNLIKHKQELLFIVREMFGYIFYTKKTKLSFLDAPKVHTLHPILAADISATNIKFQCEIDSSPESTIMWKFQDKILFNSNKYSIIQNKSLSYLILQQIQSNTDYGIYSCNATNKLGYNSTTIQLRSKGILTYTLTLSLDRISYCVCSFIDHYHII